MLEYIMIGVFAVACLFMLVACLLPIISEPGKDGWNDVE